MSDEDKLDIVEVIEAAPGCIGCGAGCLTSFLTFGFLSSLAVKWGYSSVGWFGIEYLDSPADLIVLALSVVAGIIVLFLLACLRIELFGK